MDSADKKTPDLLPSHYQELPSEDSGRHSDPRRRKIFRKITLALVSIVLLGLLVSDLTFVQKQYSAYMGARGFSSSQSCTVLMVHVGC